MSPKINIIIILIIGLIVAGFLIFYYIDSCKEIDYEAQKTLEFDVSGFLNLE